MAAAAAEEEEAVDDAAARMEGDDDAGEEAEAAPQQEYYGTDLGEKRARHAADDLRELLGGEEGIARAGVVRLPRVPQLPAATAAAHRCLLTPPAPRVQLLAMGGHSPGVEALLRAVSRGYVIPPPVAPDRVLHE